MRTGNKPRGGSSRKRQTADQGAGLGEYLFGPSDEAKARVEEIRARWTKLQAWEVARKLPNTRRSQDFIAAFLKEWETAPQVDKIGAATSDIVLMERYAEEYDRKRGGSYTAAPIGTPFDIERASRGLEGAAAVDKAAAEVAAVAKDVAKDAGKVLPDPGVAVPLAFVGVGVLAVVVVLAVKVRPAHRQPCACTEAWR